MRGLFCFLGLFSTMLFLSTAFSATKGAGVEPGEEPTVVVKPTVAPTKVVSPKPSPTSVKGFPGVEKIGVREFTAEEVVVLKSSNKAKYDCGNIQFAIDMTQTPTLSPTISATITPTSTPTRER